MPNKIIIIRHGESEPDKDNPLRGLTENGKKQIIEAAKLFSNLVDPNSALVISTCAKRAVQSAEIISTELGVKFDKTFPDLRIENIDQLGDRDKVFNLYFESFEKKTLPFKVPSPRAIVRRFFKAIENIGECETLIIVGHGGALEAFANFQQIFLPEEKLSGELGYAEFAVLTKKQESC